VHARAVGGHADERTTVMNHIEHVKLGKRLALHRLSLKIGLASAGTAGVPLLLVVVLWDTPWWVLPAGVVLCGLALYGFAYRLIAARLVLAYTTLRQIRKHQFENLEAAHLPEGDELNSLVWQVYRTGQALEEDILNLQRSESYRKEFLGNVSHELKTPIFSIRGFAETLIEGALQDEKVNRTFTEKILRNADRLNNLANDLTAISRIETGELKMTMAPFDLQRMTRDVVESLESIAESKGVTLTDRMPAYLPPVVGDADQLRHVMVNLVENAIKYNDPGGYVDVVGRLLPSGRVKVSVVDNGIGIPEEHLPRITERFYRVDKSRSRVQGGTGLGLAIVKHILGAHNTTLMIKSVPQQGSTFGFMLPTAQS
jgi:two-component system phosphate regulon sensor histidine kinase PhoR